jgi:hypothetical protein
MKCSKYMRSANVPANKACEHKRCRYFLAFLVAQKTKFTLFKKRIYLYIINTKLYLNISAF